MSFTVDSVASGINYQGLTVHLVIHPIMRVVRDGAGRLIRSQAEPDDTMSRERLMHVEIDARGEPAVLARITGALEGVLDDARAAVGRAEEPTSELQPQWRIPYAVFRLKKN